MLYSFHNVAHNPEEQLVVLVESRSVQEGGPFLGRDWGRPVHLVVHQFNRDLEQYVL